MSKPTTTAGFFRIALTLNLLWLGDIVRTSRRGGLNAILADCKACEPRRGTSGTAHRRADRRRIARRLRSMRRLLVVAEPQRYPILQIRPALLTERG
jgi:hypothetical protein